ncbi:MAG: NAD(P)H-binding protein [Gallionellaceae bacterium]|jgi:uncharacterized protein YbjT (DUF2867 family)
MNILLCGASGFVGRHLEDELLKNGHHLIRGVRTPKQPGDIAIDYRNDVDVQTWLPRLNGIDAVINAVGVLRDSTAQPMSRLHDAVPRALFAAAVQHGIKRIVQISALGVGQGINTPYMQTKQVADEYLQSLNLDWAILRPSLIYGADGASTRMFMLLSRFPMLMLPGRGTQIVQPVHINDIALAVGKLIAAPTGSPSLRKVIECVGTEEVSLANLIMSYRLQRGGSSPVVLGVPSLILKSMAWLGDRISALPVGSDTLAMLDAGTTGNAAVFIELLGKSPRNYREFLRD